MTAHRGRFVAYYRVSTAEQGVAGLGLDAQQSAVRNYLDGGTWELVGAFTEVESGRKSARPELAKALALCKKRRPAFHTLHTPTCECPTGQVRQCWRAARLDNSENSL